MKHNLRTFGLFDPYILGIAEVRRYPHCGHGHGITKRRKVMNREIESDDLIDLGAVSENTKGGPWGVDDYRGSLMIGGAGLTQD